MDMKRKELLRKYDQIETYNDREKEVYLRDLENSVYNYIRVGVENKQLEELNNLEEEFQERYEQMFEMRELTKEALEELKLADIVSSYEHNLLLKRTKESVEEARRDSRSFIEEFVEDIKRELEELLMDKWHKVIKDVAYLSHMSMLYNLYEKQRNQQRIEKAYDIVTARFSNLPDIANCINQNRRMSFTSICKEVHISEDELDELLTQANEYFNVRQKGREVQISLSPSGRKYNRYIILEKGKYSEEKMEQLLYKNCDKMMNSLEYSLNRGIELEITLEGISYDRERVLKCKYHNTVQKILSKREETYNRSSYCVNISREGANENEKLIYKIR